MSARAYVVNVTVHFNHLSQAEDFRERVGLMIDEDEAVVESLTECIPQDDAEVVS